MSCHRRRPRRPSLLLGAFTLAVSGCATTPGADGPNDPLEPLNRQVYAFNDGFDRAIARPVARGYQRVTPELVEEGIGNFFANLDDVSVLVNSILQAKGGKATRTTLRLAFNSTFGLFGLIDLAGAMGLEKENEDFGQTLGHWGLSPGPYLVLPILGPSNLRDGTGRIADAQYEALDQLASDDATYYSARVLSAIDTRADLLGASRMVDTAAVDPYTFTREAYLRRRANQVHDGNPPPEALPGEPDSQGEEGGFDAFSDEDEDLFQDGGQGGEADDGS